MDSYEFLTSRSWPADALCSDPVVARLALAGHCVKVSRRRLQRVERAGEILVEARRVAANLGLAETTEPEDGDPCVIRMENGRVAMALFRAGDFVGGLADGKVAFSRAEVLAAWRVDAEGSTCPR